MDGYSTHLPVLEEVIRAIGKPKEVLEYGCGINSTPWLLAHCDHLTSVELKRDWIGKTIEVVSREDSSRWLWVNVQDEREFPITRQYDLVLVDGGNHLHRIDCAANCLASKTCGVIAMHDTESPLYGWGHLIIPDGWHKIDCDAYWPWTTVLTTDVSLAALLLVTMKKG